MFLALLRFYRNWNGKGILKSNYTWEWIQLIRFIRSQYILIKKVKERRGNQKIIR